jgi:hypothetical protein
MIFKYKGKNSDLPVPYTYMIYFKLNEVIHFYYGVRYNNVRLKLSPKEDLFKKYFTSSTSVNNLLENGILPYKVAVHKTFNSYVEACKYEVSFLNRLDAKNRKDFLNQTNNFDNSLPNNLGRVRSKENRKKMSEAATKAQSSDEYKKRRSEDMKNKWNDPEFRHNMNAKNEEYKESGKSKDAGKKSGLSRIGIKYSDDVKIKRSKALSAACKLIDCSARAINRKRYVCPMCDMSKLDGSNFNRHMISRHDWDKTRCTSFKHSICSTY